MRESMTMKLTVMRGVSGSGKSTIAQALGCPVFSADDDMMSDGVYCFNHLLLNSAHRNTFLRVMECLAQGRSCAVDNTNTTSWEISPFLSLAAAFEVEVEIIEVRCNPYTAHNRNKHNVPLETILRQNERMQSEHLPRHWKVTVRYTG